MIDRLVYAVPDFEQALADLAERTGVQPERIAGGCRDAYETAWLGLGGDAYLEIVASRRNGSGPVGATAPPYPGLDRIEQAQLLTWGLVTPHIEILIEYWRAYGYDPGPLEKKAFTTPSGDRLEWRETIRQTHPGDGLIPSLVERPVPHASSDTPPEARAKTPSSAAPQGCVLRRFQAEHPEPHKIASLLYMLDIDLYLREGPAPALVAELGTPRGNLRLVSAPPRRIDHVRFGSLTREVPVQGRPGQA